MYKQMTHREMFGDAEWITSDNTDICPVIRRDFDIRKFDNASIDILGFAAFTFYVNGERGSLDYFLPLATDYEWRDSPVGEETAHRAYVSHYDITELLREGKNSLSVLLGDGWYTGHTGKYKEVPYGEKKLCFKITVKYKENTTYICSDTSAVWSESHIKECDLNFGEVQDYGVLPKELISGEMRKGEWKSTVLAKEPETRYFYTDCPPDRVVETITPTVVGEMDGGVIYDAGKNITGFPTLITDGYVGEIEVTYSEGLGEDGDLLPISMHQQKTVYRVYGGRAVLEPCFTWLGFRYFKVRGEAVCNEVKRINCDIAVSSHFECEDETLNWLYNAYILTQLSNMHQGIPSDCPHIERRGYIGDGHLTAPAAMMTLAARSFYRKWIYDISDSQDRISGHAQYTAPYTHSGGGVGGFAHGFIKIPYQYYLNYGDKSPLYEMYGQFCEYLRYLEEHSVSELLVSDKEGEWCLGEWCAPMDKTGDMLSISPAKPGGTFLPPAYVNTVYCVKSLELMIRIAEIVGRSEDIPLFRERIERKKTVIKAAFYNPNNGTFIGNMQGANAFALDIGLGDERTKESFIAYYEKYPYFDTGIFGTEVVTRLLCEYGRADIVRKMMTASEPHGYGKWREMGATTLWEYWKNPRSMSHPMFGSTVALLFEHILGIKQIEGSSGYRDIIIAPAMNTGLGRAEGHITVEGGVISVRYSVEDGVMTLTASVPSGVKAQVVLGDDSYVIEDGGALTVTKVCDQ